MHQSNLFDAQRSSRLVFRVNSVIGLVPVLSITPRPRFGINFGFTLLLLVAPAVAMIIEPWSFREHRWASLVLMVCLVHQNLSSCWSLNDEGLALLKFRDRVESDPLGALSNWSEDVGVIDPCSWFGVECSDGNVVALNLKDLCLGGTLSSDIGNLHHVKSIILRNNAFYGVIPKAIGELKDLKVLDVGHNNFSGPLPSNLGDNLSLAILLLDKNELLGSMSPELQELQMISEVQVDENQLSNAAKGLSCTERSMSWNIPQNGDSSHRRLLEKSASKLPADKVQAPPQSPSPLPMSKSPSHSSSPSLAPSTMAKPDLPLAPTPHASPASLSSPMPSLAESPNTPVQNSKPKHHQALILALAIGGPVLLVFVISIYVFRGNKVSATRPWATGLTGQLQKVFVTGVPKLKRSELEAACEDFSNVIGTSSIGIVYKGTLSNGVEIAVASVLVNSLKEWSNHLEAQLRKKIELLSKVNHKNFVNLLGYCEEDEPFTRMLVFEYAPNGTLFEHLHSRLYVEVSSSVIIKEAEHLDWGMRMRIMMGTAYCLEHMHQLTPPIAHKNLNSLAVNLTEDYAAKVSDFGFWSEVAAAEMKSNGESNAYSFGVMLFEMVTGRLTYSVENSSLEDWASDYLSRDQPLREMVDPTLNSFQEEQLEQISEVIKSCVHPDQEWRPEMREVTARLRDITAIGPDAATPKLNPLWWAVLQILTTDASE